MLCFLVVSGRLEIKTFLLNSHLSSKVKISLSTVTCETAEKEQLTANPSIKMEYLYLRFIILDSLSFQDGLVRQIKLRPTIYFVTVTMTILLKLGLNFYIIWGNINYVATTVLEKPPGDRESVRRRCLSNGFRIHSLSTEY